MSSNIKYILYILLLVFVLTSTNQNTQQYLNPLQSLSFTTTSFILPITYKHNQWIISSSHPVTNDNKIISLQIFFNQLSFQQHKHINIQLHIISSTTTNKQIINLYKIIHSLSNTLSITNIIIPNSLTYQSNIIQLITSYTIPITPYIDSTPPSVINTHRNLLINTTTTQIITNTTPSSWVCQKWPIYISFFSGILVTVVISLAIKFSMGEHDDDIHRALEKVVHAGIGNNIEDENGNEIDQLQDLSVLKIYPPTKHTSYKSAMNTTSPNHSPVVHSRRGPKRALTELTLVGQLKNISLDNFNNFNITPRHKSHNRKVTFADEKKEKLIKDTHKQFKHTHKKSKSEPGNKVNKVKFATHSGLNLPKIATNLFNIPSTTSINLNVNPAEFINAASASRSSTSDEIQLQLEENKEEISELSVQVNRGPLRPAISVESNSATHDFRSRKMDIHENDGNNGNDIELNDVDEIIDIVHDEDMMADVNDNVDMDEDPCILSDTEIP